MANVTIQQINGGTAATTALLTDTIEAQATAGGASKFFTVATLADACKAFTTNVQTGTTYTLVLADRNNAVRMTNASANVVTIPQGLSFVENDTILFLQYGAGQTSFVAPTIAAPVQANTSTSTSGGTLAAATYYYVISALNANGETIKSNEESQVTTGSTSSNVISWAAVTGATGYRIYRGTAAGAENVYYTVGAVTTYTDTNAASTGGTPSATNTAVTVVIRNRHATLKMLARYGQCVFRYLGSDEWIVSGELAEV